VNVISPESGAVYLNPTGPVTIGWTASDVIGLAADPITIYYSENDGSSWDLIVGSLPNTGRYDWTVPRITSTNCRVRVEAIDLAGNVSQAASARFSIIHDDEAPRISITSAGLTVTSGDFINPNTQFDIRVTDNVSLAADSLSIQLDNDTVVYYLSSVTQTQIDAFFKPASLAEGDHSIKVQAADNSGNIATKEITGLIVVDEPLAIRNVIVHPMPFALDRGETANIAYVLNKDANVTIYVYSVSGMVVWTRRYAAAANGGKAGYNEVIFNGISDISRKPVANGVYVFVITVDGKAVYKGRLVVYD
jgi:hypothetical protein